MIFLEKNHDFYHKFKENIYEFLIKNIIIKALLFDYALGPFVSIKITLEC